MFSTAQKDIAVSIPLLVHDYPPAFMNHSTASPMARILIVEDEPIAAWNLQESLEALNHEVVGCISSGQEAIHMARSLLPDLIIMDIRLEGDIDGIQAAAVITDQINIPVIYLTAHSDEVTLNRVMKTSPFGYLMKPFRMKELQTSLSITLQRSQLEKRLEASEQRLAVTLNSLGDGVIATDTHQTITFMNPVAEQMSGYSTADALGQPLSQVIRLIHPQTGDDLLQALTQAIATGQVFRLPMPAVLKSRDGRDYVVGDSAAPIQTAAGDIVGGVIVFTDLTEHQSLTADLQRSQMRYQLAVQSGRVGVWDWNLDTNEMYLDPVLKGMLGYSDDAIENHLDAWSNHIHPGDRRSVAAALNAYLNGAAPEFTCEHRMLHQDGTVRWVLVRGGLVEESDRPRRMMGTYVDITPQKQAEAAYAQQTKRERILHQIAQHIRQSLDLPQVLQTTVDELQTLLAADRVLIYELSPSLRGRVVVEAIAPGWSSMDGWEIYDPCFSTPGCLEKYNQGHTQAIADIHQADLASCYVDLLDQFQVNANLVTSIVCGDRLWGLIAVQHCTAPRPWEAWEIDLLTQLSTQVAIAIQQAELYQQLQTLNTNLDRQVQDRTRDLQRSLTIEAILQRIIERVRDSLNEHSVLQSTVQEVVGGLHALGGRISLYDLPQRQARLYYDYSELSCAYVGQIMPMDGPVYEQLLQRQLVRYCPHRSETGDGRQSRLVCPIFDDQGVLGDLCIYDHSGRIFSDLDQYLVQQVASQCAIALRQARLYRAAQQQLDQLERLNQLKDEFLSTISHELRTPIANIRMATQVIELTLSQLGLLAPEDQLSRYLHILHEEGQRQLALINDLLDLSQIDIGAATPDSLEVLNLRPWLSHLIDAVSHTLQTQQHLLILDLPDDLPTLQIESLYFERVLLELLHNACKYSPPDGTICLSARATATQLEIQLANTCPDLSQEDCDRMFEVFYRLPRRDPWQHSGTGLGLALVKKLVARLQGTIRATSQPPMITIDLTLPISPDPSQN
jgi:PAS domain S-box-containing protein